MRLQAMVKHLIGISIIKNHGMQGLSMRFVLTLVLMGGLQTVTLVLMGGGGSKCPPPLFFFVKTIKKIKKIMHCVEKKIEC